MNRSYFPTLVLIAGGMIALGAFAWQQRNINQLKAEVANLRETSGAVPDQGRQLEPPPGVQRPLAAPGPRPLETVVDPSLERRLSTLEADVAFLGQGAEHLMDRGAIPPSDAKLAMWSSLFLDANASTDARLNALRLLRRNDAFTPQMAQFAASWLSGETNPDVLRSLLESVRGEDDPALKAATLVLAQTSTDGRVRDRAITNLRAHVEDPQVESMLWQLATTDPSDGIRRRAEDTLRRAPMTDSRASSLESRVLDPAASWQERLTSLRLLSSGEQDISAIAPVLAQAAQAVTEPQERLQFYAAFDDVNDPSFMLPLVQGAQDKDSAVRLRATDALIDYRAEPAIAELLKAMAQTDPDPRVRQEAARVFRDGRR